jgi:hypothetical protein
LNISSFPVASASRLALDGNPSQIVAESEGNGATIFARKIHNNRSNRNGRAAKMADDREPVAWHAVNALIEDAQRNFKGKRGQVFAWAIYNAVRRTNAAELGNLRALLQKHRVAIHGSAKQTWAN